MKYKQENVEQKRRQARPIEKKLDFEKNRMGVFLVDLFKLDQPRKGKQELYQDLLSISEAGGKNVIRQYYIKKMSMLLYLLWIGIGVAIFGYLIYAWVGSAEEMKVLDRPGYGEGDRKEALSVQIEGEEEIQNVEVTVQERKYTEKEKEELLQTALGKLEEILPGENRSLDEVRTNLIFPQSMENNAISIMWLTDPYGILSDDGSILKAEDENGTLVEITATLTCGEQELIYSSYARVYPPLLSEQEQLRQTVQKEVTRADDAANHEEELKLPDSVDGKKLVWTKVSENPFPSILFLSILLMIYVYVQMDNAIHKKAVQRKTQLLLDYPDLMWRMTMLLGAGLSIRGTFERIAQEYHREQKRQWTKKGKLPVRYVYEEVSYTCYEMQSGISEAQAYERFGKRCQLPEYIRVGSVLSQNLKKGAKGLTSMLETEAEASLNDRKNNARKIGEKAGTKLLLPMILMLGVVLAILMGFLFYD